MSRLGIDLGKHRSQATTSCSNSIRLSYADATLSVWRQRSLRFFVCAGRPSSRGTVLTEDIQGLLGETWFLRAAAVDLISFEFCLNDIYIVQYRNIYAIIYIWYKYLINFNQWMVISGRQNVTRGVFATIALPQRPLIGDLQRSISYNSLQLIP